MKAHDLTHDWLADCANALAQDPARLAHPERWLWGRQAPTARLRLPLLLVSEDTGELRGHRAWLTLALMPAPGACLTLAPLPASALLPVDTHWAAVMSELQAGVQVLLSPEGAAAASPCPWQDWAIGWDVAPQTGEAALASLEGRSAAASLTLGVLWLVRRWLNPSFSASPLWPLACLSQAELERCWVSADVRWPAGQPVLASVDPQGLVAKAAALARYDDTALLHTFQAVEGRLAQRVRPATDWDGLLAGMGAERGWTPAQAQLLWALLSQADVSRDLSLPVDTALVSVGEPSVQQAKGLNHRQAALCQFARWEHASEGPVTRWHVPLGLAPEESAMIKEALELQREEFKKKEGGPSDGKHHKFDRVLRYTVSKQAIVLEGEPGAGKTTLMRHWVQTCCRQALGAWELGQRPVELPLYLPLNELEADQDPVDWARRYLTAHGMGEWVTWALPTACADSASAAPPAWLPLAWRWVCDGLNELPFDPSQGERQDRALAVVDALQKALQQPTVPLQSGAAPTLPLLSIRGQHFNHSEWLRMVLLPWEPGDINTYLVQRFGAEHGQAHMETLQAQPAVMQLARNPLMLAGLADLLDEGWRQLPRNRALLYAAWLWLRLRRALGLASLARARQWVDKSVVKALLSTKDRDKLNADRFWLEPAHTMMLPLEGPLLGALVQQAQAQYWQDREAGRPQASRCDVAVLWEPDPQRPQARSVASTWQDWSARAGGVSQEAWGHALVALGVVAIDPVRNTFRFSHQSWGEFLASLSLLEMSPEVLKSRCDAGDPQAVQQWRRVMVDGAAPPVPDPAQELTQQRKDLAVLWEAALTPERRLKLLREGLRVTWSVFCADRDIPEHTLPQDTSWANYFAADPLHGAILSLVRGDEGKVFVRADLRAWGERFWLQETFDATVGTVPGQRWMDSAVGLHDVIKGWLFPCFQQAAWAWLLSNGVDVRQVESLRKEAGTLPEPPVSDVQEVLTLALLGLADPVPWLLTLLTAVVDDQTAGSQAGSGVDDEVAPRGELWRSAVPAALLWRDALEPAEADNVWERGMWSHPHPLLQFLRLRLLLNSVDAGVAAQSRLQASGVLSLLGVTALSEAVVQGDAVTEAQWLGLNQAWVTLRQQAFAPGAGVRLQGRIQCALWLSELGDNLRFERAQHPGDMTQRGLLLRPPLWAAQGTPGEWVAYEVGVAHGEAPNEAPLAQCELPGFLLPIYPVTVVEFECFIASGGYDPDKPWWDGQALHWLREHGGVQRRPVGWAGTGSTAGLLPAVSLNFWEAQAYARWAQALRPVRQTSDPHPVARGRMGLPSELHMQAAARGPVTAQRRVVQFPFEGFEWPAEVPQSLVFNHVSTRLGRLAPVGVFSLSLSALGVEQCGNCLTWTRNAAVPDYEGAHLQEAFDALSPDSEGKRAMVGGSFNYTFMRSHVACRLLTPSRTYINDTGMRLMVEPHPDLRPEP